MDLHLVGDVGGTNARFGLFCPREDAFVEPPVTLLCNDYASLEALVGHYLKSRSTRRVASAWAIAVAGPVERGVAHLTNLGWTVSESRLEAAGLPPGVLVNDYEALALAASTVISDDVFTIGGPGGPRRAGTVAVLGPGTGFGAAAHCVDTRGASTVLVTEGGHIGFAPTDEVEVEIWRRLAARFGRVSIERILSGPGLVNLHEAFCALADQPSTFATPAAILAAAGAGDAGAQVSVERFCRILGATAGDFALAYGAVGGVLLAGGIAPRLRSVLVNGRFRAAFEAKGRFTGYLSEIATDLVVNPYLALVGAAVRLGKAND